MTTTDPQFLADATLLEGVKSSVQSGDDDTQNLLDIEISKLLHAEQHSHGFSCFAPARQVYFASSHAEAEVNSGGFNTLIEYSDPDLLKLVPDAFRYLGASELADITERALREIPGFPEIPDWEVRSDLVDHWMDKPPMAFESLEQRLFSQTARLERLRYSLEHQDQFFKA